MNHLLQLAARRGTQHLRASGLSSNMPVSTSTSTSILPQQLPWSSASMSTLIPPILRSSLLGPLALTGGIANSTTTRTITTSSPLSPNPSSSSTTTTTAPGPSTSSTTTAPGDKDTQGASQTSPPPWHTTYNPSLEDQTLTIPTAPTGGSPRTLGFAQYGNPTGTPAILLHGAPGSRYDGIAYHESALKLSVRIICPDRPGHGLSTFVPGRKLTEYPADIAALVRHLGIQGRYHVFGQSGGGPYAVACARFSPDLDGQSQSESQIENESKHASVGADGKDVKGYADTKEEEEEEEGKGPTLGNVGVVAGMGPPEILNIRTAGWYTVLALWFHTHTPGLLKWWMNYMFPLETIHDDAKLQGMIEKTVRWLPKRIQGELVGLQKPEVMREMRAHLRCMFAQGWEGTIRDGQIYARDWGFKLGDVQKRGVLLVYGGRDSRTPLAFGRWYKRHLRDARLVEYEGDSHITIGERVDEILAMVTGKEELLREIREREAKEKEAEGKEGASD